MLKDEWLTPPEIIKALGPFDLDPCASVQQPWYTARKVFTLETDGLAQGWPAASFVWCNPPYGKQAAAWLERMAQHSNGLALLFARTETEMFHRWVWGAADALFFFRGRLHFYHPDGTRAKANAGGPSVLVAYGQKALWKLQDRALPFEGKLVVLT